MSRVTEYSGLFLGPVLLVVALYLRGGIEGLIKAAPMAEPLLQVEGLTKRFGGVVATEASRSTFPHGEFHAIIGPNGAGKTTLIGLLAGEIAPRSGTIRFDGSDITALPVYRRSQLGLARSFQITSLFPRILRARQCRARGAGARGHSFRFWRDARSDNALRAPATAALARVGLAARRPGRQAQPRRAPPTRNRHGARDPPADAAARRADGRHGAG